MAFGRLERRTMPRPIGEINMTPLIDVMLVLLVIFMITAPLMTARLPLQLPQVEAPAGTEPGQALQLGLDAAGALSVDGRPVDPAQLDERLRRLAQTDRDAEVQLRADRRVPYGRVAELIAQVQKAGLGRIAFVAEAAASAP